MVDWAWHDDANDEKGLPPLRRVRCRERAELDSIVQELVASSSASASSDLATDDTIHLRAANAHRTITATMDRPFSRRLCQDVRLCSHAYCCSADAASTSLLRL